MVEYAKDSQVSVSTQYILDDSYFAGELRQRNPQSGATAGNKMIYPTYDPMIGMDPPTSSPLRQSIAADFLKSSLVSNDIVNVVESPSLRSSKRMSELNGDTLD